MLVLRGTPNIAQGNYLPMVANAKVVSGLFRYKRLSFGVNAAPEKCQHIISHVIADIEGVVNIADDLIVHGKTVAEHD